MLSQHIFTVVLAVARIVQAQYASTTTFTFAGKPLPTGLAVSNYPVDEDANVTSYDHHFEPSLSYVKGGYLNLLVPGGQQNGAVIRSAEVATAFTVSAARVDTWAMLTQIAGVCNGQQRKHLPVCLNICSTLIVSVRHVPIRWQHHHLWRHSKN